MNHSCSVECVSSERTHTNHFQPTGPQTRGPFFWVIPPLNPDDPNLTRFVEVFRNGSQTCIDKVRWRKASVNERVNVACSETNANSESRGSLHNPCQIESSSFWTIATRPYASYSNAQSRCTTGLGCFFNSDRQTSYGSLVIQGRVRPATRPQVRSGFAKERRLNMRFVRSGNWGASARTCVRLEQHNTAR